MEEKNTILSDIISDKLLMQYVEGKLSPEDARKVEEAMASSEFICDAAEGLSAVESKENIHEVVDDLNLHLKSLTKKQNKRLQKNKPLDINWIIIAILVLTIVCVGGYLAVNLILHHG